MLSHASARVPLSGIVWLSYEDSVFCRVWRPNEISGPVGSRFDCLELLDVDGDGDVDARTTEENYGGGRAGLGLIWYENPDAAPDGRNEKSPRATQ